MKDYEINEKTLAVIPSGTSKSKVYEDNDEFFVDKDVHTIMEESCQYFGSTLEGRQKGTTSLLGITHKTPIIVEETKEIIFFPTSSPRREICAWVSLNNLESYKKVDDKILLTFANNKEVELNTTYGIIDNQVLRATRLESILRKRKNKC